MIESETEAGPAEEVATEIERKRERVARELRAAGLERAIFRGLDWVSWALAGAETRVLLSAETGAVDVVIEADGALRARTDEIEAERLRAEELPGAVELEVRPWGEPDPAEVGGRRAASDRPRAGELELPAALHRAKLVLEPGEQDRLRRVGRLAAFAMEETLARARPEWSELELAGEGSRACVARGLDPCMVLAAGARRAQIYRHPLPKAEALGRKATLVFCARRWGLFANITRLRFFDAPTAEEAGGIEALARLEDLALRLSVEGRALGEIHAALAREYALRGFPEGIRRHHQGGLTGYRAREEIARPGSGTRIGPGMAVAWNPSLPGLKKEDTALIHDGRFEIVTAAVRSRLEGSHVGQIRDLQP